MTHDDVGHDLPPVIPGPYERPLAFGALGVGLLLTILALAIKPATGGEEHESEEHHDEGRVELDDGQIAGASIALEKAAPAAIAGVLRVRGQVSLNRDAVTTLAPRFGGTVASLSKNLGDTVRRGEAVARVESSATRAQIELRSGIDGVVTEIRAGRGSYASSTEPLVVVADLSKVWAEFHVIERDAVALETGDAIKVKESLGSRSASGVISYVSPTVDEDTQSVVVRAVLANPDGKWRPGTFIDGEISTGSTDAVVAVKRTGLHDLDGKTVVFVRSEGHFVPKIVRAGALGQELAEVVEGLKVGEIYAAENSYVVKAELLKSEAEH